MKTPVVPWGQHGTPTKPGGESIHASRSAKARSAFENKGMPSCLAKSRAISGA